MALNWLKPSKLDVRSLITTASPEVFLTDGGFGLVISKTSEPDRCLLPDVGSGTIGSKGNASRWDTEELMLRLSRPSFSSSSSFLPRGFFTTFTYVEDVFEESTSSWSMRFFRSWKEAGKMVRTKCVGLMALTKHLHFGTSEQTSADVTGSPIERLSRKVEFSVLVEAHAETPLTCLFEKLGLP